MLNVPLTLGVEEEYQIIHPDTRNLHSFVQQFLEHGKMVFPDDTLKPEFMQSQVEVGSRVCRDVQEVRAELQRLRHAVGEIARASGMQFASASTHPFATWSAQEVTAGERYRQLLEQYQTIAAQLLIFGFHLHIGLGEAENNDLKIDVMNQLRYFLPHILALSTSSPFWQGQKSGLKSYRSVVFEMLPRTGMAPLFSSYGEYQAYVELLARVGTITYDANGKPDGTRIWWDIRPHPKFGTLEIRIPDLCTRLEDAVCIAALVQSLTAKLIQLRMDNQSWRVYGSQHIQENKWRAMRYGVQGKLVDFGKQEEIPMLNLGLEIIELVKPQAKQLGCWAEVQYAEKILREGTSADRQLRIYDNAIAAGQTHEDALKAVVDHLVRETVEGI
jgi:carboxylate-amine ligase